MPACGYVVIFIGQNGYSQVSGLNYTFSPLVERIYWGDNAGIGSGDLYGGSLGIGFGQFVELHGSYLSGNSFQTDPEGFFAEYPGLENGSLELLARELDIRKFGLATKLNLGTSAVVPYLTAGAGMMQFKPNELPDTRTFYYSGGGGLMTSIASRFSIYAEANYLGYGLNPASAFEFPTPPQASAPGEVSPEFLNGRLHNNWALQVGVKAYLGGSRYADPLEDTYIFPDEFNGGLKNSRFILAPVYGQIYFDEALGLPSTQHFAGINAGFEFSPHIALEGFYWRGVNDEESFEFEELQMYGAEFKTSLFRAGVTPYITVGAGYFQVMDEYRPETTPAINDQIFGLGGIGLDLDLSNSISIDAAFRTLLNTVPSEESTSWLNDVTYSTMFSVGISFKLGSRKAFRESRQRLDRFAEVNRPVNRMPDLSEMDYQQPADSTVSAETVESEIAEETAPPVAERPEITAEQQIFIMREAALTTEIAKAFAAEDSATAQYLIAERDELRAAQPAPAVHAVADSVVTGTGSHRLITLPVLEEGEIYIRFGKPEPRPFPAAAEPAPQVDIDSEEELEAHIRNLLNQYLNDTGRDTLTADADIEQRLNDLEQRMLEAIARSDERVDATATGEHSQAENLDERLEQFESRIVTMLNEREAERAAVPQPVTSETSSARTTTGSISSGAARELSGLYVYTGFANPLQMLLGVRADYGSILGDRLNMRPEFVFGFGSGTNMYNVNFNALYDLKSIRTFEPFEPYAGLGLGILAFSNPPDNAGGIQFTGSILLGAERQWRGGKFFVEYANMNLFKFNRLQAGYRFNL